ncbi:hypothetical protein [Ornithinimicrobium sp. W1665]|uniref:hypothetical protein n=1 Tax=Ornithinimicrobium sp. W1665 TaxID=3416666 RepID=UPI003CEB0117
MPVPPEPAVGDAGDRPTSPVPSVEALRRTVAEQTPLLTGPTLHDSVVVRVRRVLTSADELLELLGEDGDEVSRDTVSRALAWVVESVGAYERLPGRFAAGHAVTGDHAPLLALVDDLDLLGLTLDHAYDAAHRQDDRHARRQHTVLLERFDTASRPDALVGESGVAPEHLDHDVVRDKGLDVGEDGIPRLPVPEQPDPHHAPTPDPVGAGVGPDDQPQEDQ